MRPSFSKCRRTAGPRFRRRDCGWSIAERRFSIVPVTLLLWAATNFPMHHGQPPEVQNSIVAQLGHAIEPVIRPLGFDWKIGVGLVTSLAAREVIIATLGTLNGVDPQSHATDLQAALRHELTPAAAVALLVF